MTDESFAKPMPVTSPSTIGLDLEDFRRLGVRPFECRLAVIRSASARSARTLAQQQLSSPSDQAGLQLSRVATSTYRLLDPRQRQDSNQRAYVGRILPIALNWAGQTKFHSGEVTTFANAPFSVGSSSDALDDADPTADAIELDDRPTPWTITANDHDLIEAIPLTTRVVRKQSRLPQTWVWVTIACVAIVTILGFATMRTGDTQWTSARSEAIPQREPLPSRDVAIEPKFPVEAETTEFQSADRSTAQRSTAVNPNALSSQTALPPRSVDQRDSAAPEPVRELESDLSGIVRSLPNPLSPHGATDLPPQTPPIDQIDPVISDAMKKPEAKSAAEPGAGLAEPSLTPAATRHSIPADASVRAARAQLISLVPGLGFAVGPQDAPQRIAEIEALAGTLHRGSADDWTARITIAQLAWLVEDVTQVSQRLQSLTDNYHVPIEQPLADSFVAACDLATLPATHQHLLSNGLRLADQLLMHESFEPCKRVVAALGPSAELLESEHSDHYLQQLSQAADQMARQAQSASRMVDGFGEIDGGGDGGGVLGRYYCLMLRQWDVGLSWLAQGSDARIANVARQEIELGDTPSAEDLVLLSQRWLAAASRSRGRAADSMRLHAIDLMQQAQADTSEFAKLEIERTIDETLELLPPFLRVPPRPREATTPIRAAQRDGATEPILKNGLSGRIKIDGQDIGVQLDYQLGVSVTQSLLDTIAQRLDRTLSQTSIQFVGQLQLDEPTTVLVSVGQSNDGTQQVRIDGDLLEFDPREDGAKVSLPAGMHSIAWTIEAERISERAYLGLHDSGSGRRLSVVQPTGSANQRTTLTVSLVRGEP